MQPDLGLLLTRIANALDGARDDLERLSATLCADADVVLRHIAALQTLDRVGQCQTDIALLLRAHDPAAAVEAIRLDRLRSNLDGGAAA
jgi:hypothetical protein